MLSIIVPIYNVEKYLPKCIDSLLSQTYSEIEIILINDGSTDNCGKICDDYKAKDSRIKVLHKENGGLVSAWTRGVSESKGEYIGFVDSDDYCSNDYFEKIMNAVVNSGADIGIAGYIEERPKRSEIRVTGSRILSEGIYEQGELEKIKKEFFKDAGLIYYARWLRVLKRELVLKNLPLVDLRIKVGEDIGIALATLYDARKIALVATSGYHYVWRESSLLHKFSDSEITNYSLLCENISNICQKKGYSLYIYREFAAQLTLVISKILRAQLNKKEKIEYLKLFRENKYVKMVYEKQDFGKCSWKRKIVLKLFAKRHYKMLCLLPVGR